MVLFVNDGINRKILFGYVKLYSHLKYIFGVLVRSFDQFF